MLEAAMEIKEAEGGDIGVSFDGTWQRRGYSSLNGVGTAISVKDLIVRHSPGIAKPVSPMPH